MPDILLHPSTRAEIAALTTHPSHAVLLVGPSGVGKGSVARTIAAQLTGIDPEKVMHAPYIKTISAQKESSISIETIRELEHFLALRVPGTSKRVIIIEDAHDMTTEAQNALLKTLEEPPLQTTILLTSSGEQSMLPTIRSRVTTIHIRRPARTELAAAFGQQGYSETAIQQGHLMSGGLPGLMTALLEGNTEHPLVQAAATAREIIQKTTFERLAMVDQLAKQKQYSLDVLAILQQMAHVAVASGKQTTVWQRVLRQSYQATELLLGNAQAKLVLTDLMLSL